VFPKKMSLRTAPIDGERMDGGAPGGGGLSSVSPRCLGGRVGEVGTLAGPPSPSSFSLPCPSSVKTCGCVCGLAGAAGSSNTPERSRAFRRSRSSSRARRNLTCKMMD
jgi:hypothetical protein